MPFQRSQVLFFAILLLTWQSSSQASQTEEKGSSLDACFEIVIQEFEWNRIGRSTRTPDRIWQYLDHRELNFFSKDYIHVLLMLTQISDGLRGELLDRVDHLSMKDSKKLILELLQPNAGSDSEVFTDTKKYVEGLLEKYSSLPDPSIRKLGKFPLSDPEINAILSRVFHSYLKGLAHLKPRYLNSAYREKYIEPMKHDWWEQVSRLDPDVMGSILLKSKKLTPLYQNLLFENLFLADSKGEITIQLIQVGANSSARLKPEILEASWANIVDTPLSVQNLVTLLHQRKPEDSQEFLETSIDFLSDPLNYEKNYPSAIPRVKSTAAFTPQALHALGKNWKRDPRINEVLRKVENSSIAEVQNEAKIALLMRGETPSSYDSLIEMLQGEKGASLLFELIGMHARGALQKTTATGKNPLIESIRKIVKADGTAARILSEAVLGKHTKEWGELANPTKVIQFVHDYEISGPMLDATLR